MNVIYVRNQCSKFIKIPSFKVPNNSSLQGCKLSTIQFSNE